MSTFLVSLGVVAATIAAVLYVALNGPDQPATIRRQPSPAPGDAIDGTHEPGHDRGGAVEPMAGSGVAGRDGAGSAAPTFDVPTEADLAVQPRVLTVTDLVVPAPSGAGGVAALPVAPVSAAAQAPAMRVVPDSEAMRLRVLPAAPTTLWVRIRSGVALVVLVAVLGALLAMLVGGTLVGAAFLIRSATS